jgi:hypothetical protein
MKMDLRTRQAMGRKRFEPFEPRNRRNKPNRFVTTCHRLPPKSHGKQGVCHGLPPLGGGPLPAREEVDPLAPQNAKSREPEGPQDSTVRL